MKGSGYLAGIFIGGEYFILDRLSFALDLAPTFISLGSGNFSVDGFEWVVNLGIYYHFGQDKKYFSKTD